MTNGELCLYALSLPPVQLLLICFAIVCGCIGALAGGYFENKRMKN